MIEGLLKEAVKYYAQVGELQAKCAKYEAALKEIQGKATFPKTENEMGVTIYNILKVCNEALSAGGDGARDKMAALCHALAEEVSKDAETAEAYLRQEGVDVDKIKEDAKFITWLAELAVLLHKAANGQPVKINQSEARKWYDDGMTAYQCFRETWNME